MADDAARCSQSAAGDTTNQDENTGGDRGTTTPDQRPVEGGDSPQPHQQLPSDEDNKSGGNVAGVESIITHNGGNDFEKAQSNEFMPSAKAEYEHLLQDLQVWCRFEAEKHVIEGLWFQRRCMNLETAAKVLGCISVASVAGFVLKYFARSGNTDDLNPKWSQMGLLGFSAILGAAVLQFLGKGSDSLLPTFKEGADAHRKMTFGWNRLKHQTKITRIELRNPDVDSYSIRQMHGDLLDECKQLSETILVSEKTCKHFDSQANANVKFIEQEERQFLEHWPVNKFKPVADRMAYDMIPNQPLMRATQGQ